VNPITNLNPSPATDGALAIRVVSPSDRPRFEQVGALAVAAVSIILLGALDSVTGERFSFGIFYLIPVSLAAVVVSRAQGYLLAALASITWAVAERLLFGDADLTASVWNAVGRFVSMAVVVYLLAALRTTVIRLSESERASREFLATAAHQLRTPIAGLVASAEALTYESDPTRRSALVENLIAGTNRSRRLLSSLLELSRLDHAIPSERRLVDLAALARREVETARIAGPQIRVVYLGPSELIADAASDAVREALSNLIDNALRHAVSSVEVRLVAGETGIAIDVVDDGPGLPIGAEHLAFERFVSLDGAGGSGLGLPIALASLRAAGGDLHYGSGRFRITL